MKRIRKLINWITGFFTKLDKKYQNIIDFSIISVNAVKKFMDGNLDDIMIDIAIVANPKIGAIAGNLKDKLENKLPELIVKLSLMQEIPGETIQKQAQYVLKLLKVSDKDTQKAFYHSLCSLITESLSDGKITWSESTMINEARYKKLI